MFFLAKEQEQYNGFTHNVNRPPTILTNNDNCKYRINALKERILLNCEHSYWIPTNRDVEACISSYLEEIDYWYKLSGMSIPIFVLDSGVNDIEQKNSFVIGELAKKYPHLSIKHVSLNCQQKIVSALLQAHNLPSELINFIVPSNTNYGAVMNKIAIFAAMLGSNFIHRRDSDTVLQQNCPYPLELEILALKRSRLSEFVSEPAAVGGGYVGEWSMDLKPFIRISPALFSTFWSCLDVDESLHNAIFEKLDNDSRSFYKNDSINYTDKAGFFLPDAGNVAFTSFYKLFPCLPSNAMSSDYSLFRFARGLGLPIIYHQRRVVHEYHKERGNNVDGYLKSLLKYCDLRPIYTELERQINQAVVSGSISASDHPQNAIANFLQEISQRNTDKRMENLHRFLTNFIAPCYPEWANRYKPLLNDIFNECNQDYLNHITLLREWQKIIVEANRIKCQPEFLGNC